MCDSVEEGEGLEEEGGAKKRSLWECADYESMRDEDDDRRRKKPGNDGGKAGATNGKQKLVEGGQALPHSPRLIPVSWHSQPITHTLT